MNKTQMPKVRKAPKNLNLDAEVTALFEQYCNANREVHSVSREVEDFMIATIAKKGRAYGLRLPARLA